MSPTEYTIYENIFQPNNDVYIDFQNQLASAGPIFNSTKNDNKRRQCNLKITKTNTEFITKLTEFVKNLNPQLTPSKWVLIKSKPGCKKQLAHIDYENTPDFQTCIKTQEQIPLPLPLLVLVALQPKTAIYIWKKSTEVIQGIYKSNQKPISPTKIELQAGSIFVFRPDLVHAGSDYAEENIRMHCYLDSPLVHRDKNRTFIIGKHGDEYMQKYIAE